MSNVIHILILVGLTFLYGSRSSYAASAPPNLRGKQRTE